MRSDTALLGQEAEDRSILAQAAYERGRAASEPAERIRWLDRAHRYFPADPVFALALAEALLGRDDARAARLLAGIVARHDIGAAWLALAAAHRRRGQSKQAAAALAQALARHVLPANLAPLADAIAAAAGFPGWCGWEETGAVIVGPPGVQARQQVLPAGLVRVRAHGRELLGSPLSPRGAENEPRRGGPSPVGPVPLRSGLRAWRRRAPAAGAVALITHDQGGGVERAVLAEATRLSRSGVLPLLLKPALPGSGAGIRIADPACVLPDLLFSVPEALPELRGFMRALPVRRIAVHHLLGHAPEIRLLLGESGIPYEVHVHDHAFLCPRVVLLGAEGIYCGEPDLAGCASCIARAGSFMDDFDDAAALRSASAALLGRAARVVVPSRDTAERLRRYFPAIRPIIRPLDRVGAPAPRTDLPVPGRIAVVGGIGPAKGYHVLLALARDAALRRLPLDFVVVGATTGDAALMETGRVFVTGPFAGEEAVSLIRAQHAALALLPSVVPESWCYALSDCWRAGLDVAAFDLGAQAARIRRSGGGLLFPLGTPPARMNDRLLAASGEFRHEDASQETRTGT
ncbi:MAG TPA: hypothetical protein VFA03_16555 [Acetobacteraceae bacterium]|nr:hypothetical protein [Acetobacteraceae bacterium]